MVITKCLSNGPVLNKSICASYMWDRKLAVLHKQLQSLELSNGYISQRLPVNSFIVSTMSQQNIAISAEAEIQDPELFPDQQLSKVNVWLNKLERYSRIMRLITKNCWLWALAHGQTDRVYLSIFQRDSIKPSSLLYRAAGCPLTPTNIQSDPVC